ncbi:MAG: putative DNA modification/repair radical SAM protein [Tractidigestivibacter sp.]|uniref:putative DNA modification/repair radical SAM protein n=1 Tax=Tractidigestivibacter sp. TaxID=2847320 RepID=UPI003D8DBF4B
MDTLDKLGILAEAAKYDAACTSSGSIRGPRKGKIGVATPAGCCHSFTPDGRCVTLLKVLMSNACTYDCAYCVNRRSASCKRATFTPRELAELTVDFYKRNYIEGLFLSSGVLGTPDETSERMIECLKILREELRFNGYVHAKVIPGTSPELIDQLGHLADRLSSNLELPSSGSLTLLCPDKDAKSVTRPMSQIFHTREQEALALSDGKTRGRARLSAAAPKGKGGKRLPDADNASKRVLASANAQVECAPPPLYANGSRLTLRQNPGISPSKRRFAPAGQSTQIIIGATPEDDNRILTLSNALYQRFDLKRVFFSAYIPMMDDERLPEVGTPVPLRREHRLYQADWLMRYYAFKPDELATPEEPWLDLDIDPKLAWALRHIDLFPVEVMDAPLELLLRVPGVGPVGARRIVAARTRARLTFEDLKRMRVTLKRARYFLSCSGQRDPSCPLDEGLIRQRVVSDAKQSAYNKARRRAEQPEQLTLF